MGRTSHRRAPGPVGPVSAPPRVPAGLGPGDKLSSQRSIRSSARGQDTGELAQGVAELFPEVSPLRDGQTDGSLWRKLH